ncbi:MFS transporter [Sulfobacillus thermotolerans]|uniref:MFS transporter n=1 Tax=Sulfobacillus thermotolerans TaxID=338644 RepID=A0ABN5H299_9FIRM|nr:MFS transporter [Sulfobacillus thermotolerans]
MNGSPSVTTHDPHHIIARLDRIPIWSLPNLFVGVLGVGFLFTFYDIFDINVSFIQTCSALVHGCSPQDASQYIGLPVLFNLLGYVVGTLILSPLADRVGRRTMLMVTLILTGLGSLGTAIVPSLTWFVLARTVTGLGIGADLAIVNTYINEVAPKSGRARFTSLLFILSSIGAFLGIWMGLVLTTPAAPWPLGLPFAMATPHFTDGWRIMYIIGALLALIGVILRIQLPESPRWLVSVGKQQEALDVVRSMESLAEIHRPLPPPDLSEPDIITSTHHPYREILTHPLYRRRTVILLGVWVFSYVTVYTFAAGLTSILTALKFPPSEAGLVAAVGGIGFILSATFAFGYSERLERRTWLPIAAILTIIGGALMVIAGSHVAWSMLGAIVLFFGFNLWMPMAYSWSTENYPTRARTTGFALVDGIGHVGGGFGILMIAPLIPALGAAKSFALIIAFLVIGAIIAQFGVKTRAQALDKISP